MAVTEKGAFHTHEAQRSPLSASQDHTSVLSSQPRDALPVRLHPTPTPAHLPQKPGMTDSAEELQAVPAALRKGTTSGTGALPCLVGVAHSRGRGTAAES